MQFEFWKPGVAVFKFSSYSPRIWRII